MKTTKPSRLTTALLATADDMRRAGVLDAATHKKITLRHLGDKAHDIPDAITGDEIRALRERAHLSQAVFARHLSLSVGYVSLLEGGAKQPTGAALALLDVIWRRGIGAIL